MTRFSIGRDDDDSGSGPSNTTTPPISKRRRTTPSSSTTTPSPPPPPSLPTTTTGTLHLYLPLLEEVSLVDVGVEEGEYEDNSQFESEEENEGQAVENVASGSRTAAMDGSSSSSVSFTLVDPDVFDCPICLDSLTVPVFQCENGHLACASCCSKIANKCPSCSWPIGYNRCRSMEKVLESVLIACWNRRYGCKVKLPYSEKNKHENTCVHAPFSCPHENCDFLGSSRFLHAHYTESHPNRVMSFTFNSLFTIYFEKNEKSILLQGETEGNIFMIIHSSEPKGRVVNVMFIGSRRRRNEFYYNIICREGDNVLQLQASVENTMKGQLPLKRFLLVPNAFVGSSGKLKLEVCIRRHAESSSNN